MFISMHLILQDATFVLFTWSYKNYPPTSYVLTTATSVYVNNHMFITKYLMLLYAYLVMFG